MESRRLSVGRAGRLAFHGLVAALTGLVYIVLFVPLARIRASYARKSGRWPRILWGPTPLISIRYWSLAGRSYGYRSDTLVYRVYPINSRADFDYVLDRYASIPLLGRLVPYGAFLWASLRYDIFTFFFDGGLLAESPLWRIELPLLKLAGKHVVVSPYGGDARLASATRALDRWNVYVDVPPEQEDRDEANVGRHRAAFARWADVMLGYNDLVEDLPRLDGVLPFALDLDVWSPVEVPEDGVVTIVHSSNHRHYKGTRFVLDAFDELKSEGLPVELLIVEGVPNDEARKAYERADIVAGDFLIGAYSYFGVEAMALGKPVVAYLRSSAAPYHPEWQECPVVNATPDTLALELRRLVLDPDLRRELGRRGPEYVRKHHSLEAVGAVLDGIYRKLWGYAGAPKGVPVSPEAAAEQPSARRLQADDLRRHAGPAPREPRQ